MKYLMTYCMILFVVIGGIRRCLGKGSLLDDLGIDSEESKKAAKILYKPDEEKAPPAQHSSAEGLPPLPLPVVPLRRTEKKNPPRPPVFIAKIASGPRYNWDANPMDTQNLLKWMATNLNLHFSSIKIPEDKIPSNPEEIPVLYRTGQTEFSFDEKTREKLRNYLLKGGTLILDTTGGRPGFARSAYEEMQKLFPDRPPYRLTFDHPLYRAYYEIKEIKYRPSALRSGAQNGVPSEIGIDIGCRTAVFFFRYDLSSGWDDRSEDTRPICLGYEIQTAKMLGANLMAYISTERTSAIPLAQALRYMDETPEKAGKVFIAQGIYHGLWKTREAGLNMLVNMFHEKTAIPVHFSREDVPLNSQKLFDVPMIFISGHHLFTFTTEEIQNLRTFIERGGTVFAEACCGRSDFDRSFRTEIRKVFPEYKLQPIPLDHIIFTFPHLIKEVTPSPALAMSLKKNGKIPPSLEAITIQNRLAVIYSPYGLSCGWEMAQCPYGREISGTDAIALGINILNYILLH